MNAHIGLTLDQINNTFEFARAQAQLLEENCACAFEAPDENVGISDSEMNQIKINGLVNQYELNPENITVLIALGNEYHWQYNDTEGEKEISLLNEAIRYSRKACALDHRIAAKHEVQMLLGDIYHNDMMNDAEALKWYDEQIKLTNCEYCRTSADEIRLDLEEES